jgi:hypothetical protein
MEWYEYQICRYFNDTSMDLRGNYETMWRNIGFDEPEYNDIAISAYFNVIKSVVDALVSKIYNQKVRAYFTPINGNWKTKRVVNDIQQYFDVLYDSQKINRKISNVFRMACVFGKGHLLVDDFNKQIVPLPPHCVSFLNSEIRYGTQTPKRCMIRYLNMPIENLKAYGISIPMNKVSVDFSWYIDVEEHKQIFFIDNSRVKELPYKPTVLPILTLYYNEPIFGSSTVSIVQELDGIQFQIDKLFSKLSSAAQLTPANQIFVLEGSSLEPKDISNKSGMKYALKMPPGTSTPPVISVTPPPYDAEWKEWLAVLIDKAYSQIGISELSAMGKKQAGLNSGVSLQTFEDIESDRFETQVTHYISAFIDLAKLLIEVLDDNDDILPQSVNNSSLKWKDVKQQSDLFKIQYSAATQMSKDPSENVKTIMNMAQTGQIPVHKLARSMNNPDLIEATKSAAAKDDAIQQTIAQAIENEVYDIPEFVPHDLLGAEITVIQEQLYSSLSGDKENDKLVEESLKRTMMLEAALLNIMQETGEINVDNPEEQLIEGNDEQTPTDVPPPPEDVPSVSTTPSSEEFANADETGGL